MVLDISIISSIAPIFAFLLVFLVSFAVLSVKKIIGENKWVQLFVSFIIAGIFVSFAGTMDLVLNIVPWVAVLLISLFFILMLTGFAGINIGNMSKPLGIVALVFFVIIFLISLFGVYSEVIVGYLPGPSFGSHGEPEVLFFLDWLYSGRVVGAILLIALSAVISWVLVNNS